MMTPRLLMVLTLSLLAACGPLPVQDSAPSHIPVDPDSVADAIPRVEPRSKYGNPVRYQQFDQTYTLLSGCKDYKRQGDASWYGTKFHGQRTSSGETYDMFAMSAAHKTLPIPCYAKVTNLENGKSIIVRINDRGPFHEGRIIDLSYVAAAKLDMLKKGTTRVEVEVIDPSTAEQPVAPAQPSTEPGIAGAEVAPEPTAGTSGGIGRLYLQVAAYSQRQNAEKARAELTLLLAERASIQTAANGVFKLWVGPLASVEEADRLAASLSSHGYANTHVVLH